DAVSAVGDFDGIAATVNSISIDLGGAGVDFAGLPTFGDLNGDGIISAAEDAALNVSLHANASDLASLTAGDGLMGAANELFSAGIDNINLMVNSEGELVTLLQDAQLSIGQVSELQAANLDVNVDFGSGQIDINALHLGAGNQITLDVNPETTGTHLSASLKDLQKLGVDAISVSGTDHITLDLGDDLNAGTTGFALDADGKFLQFVNEDGKPVGDDVLVTLNTHGLDQVFEAAQLAAAGNVNLGDSAQVGVTGSPVGIDVLGIDLANGAAENFGTGMEFNSALQTLRAEGLDLSITLDQQDAAALSHLDGSFQFNVADDVTLEMTPGTGTHLSTSLKD
ncbi:hypothetical protein EBX93_19045, partial [bacterium]|nr:hypothetical protein [bacterium]